MSGEYYVMELVSENRKDLENLKLPETIEAFKIEEFCEHGTNLQDDACDSSLCNEQKDVVDRYSITPYCKHDIDLDYENCNEGCEQKREKDNV